VNEIEFSNKTSDIAILFKRDIGLVFESINDKSRKIESNLLKFKRLNNVKLFISFMYIKAWLKQFFAGEDYNDKGIYQYNIGNYQQAIIDFTKAIKLNPFNAMAYSNLGNTHYKLGNYQQAINNDTKAIELYLRKSYDYHKVYNNRGLSHFYLGDYLNAVNDYTKAIELNPQYANAYCNRGVSYFKSDNYQLAINDYIKAIELNPQDAVAYFNRGISYAMRDNEHQAIEDIKIAAHLWYKPAQDYLKNQGIE
jgi:tetratricopeptide (TPR) repeat protein